MHQLKGHPAEDLARLCFSKLRFFPVSLKDRLRREGLWEDLAQELYRIALEGWRQGMTAREIGGMATREIRAFLKAYGYYRYREGFIKWDTPLAAVCKEGDTQDSILARASPLPQHSEGDGLEKAILNLLRKHPQGLSQCQVNQALGRMARAVAVTDHCNRLVVRGMVREIARPKGNGRRPSPMLLLAEYDLKGSILALVRGNGGLSKRQLYTRLQIPARLLDQLCAPLIKQCLVIEIKRENTLGRPLTPLLVAVQPGRALPVPKLVKTERTERIRQAYFQEGKSIKQISREFHHTRRTVRKAIRGGMF